MRDVKITRSEITISRRFGLGDAVALVAQPTAKAIDAIAGTNLRGCVPCKTTRKQALNRLFSVSLPPKKPPTQ